MNFAHFTQEDHAKNKWISFINFVGGNLLLVWFILVQNNLAVFEPQSEKAFFIIGIIYLFILLSSLLLFFNFYTGIVLSYLSGWIILQLSFIILTGVTFYSALDKNYDFSPYSLFFVTILSFIGVFNIIISWKKFRSCNPSPTEKLRFLPLFSALLAVSLISIIASNHSIFTAQRLHPFLWGGYALDAVFTPPLLLLVGLGLWRNHPWAWNTFFGVAAILLISGLSRVFVMVETELYSQPYLIFSAVSLTYSAIAFSHLRTGTKLY